MSGRVPGGGLYPAEAGLTAAVTAATAAAHRALLELLRSAHAAGFRRDEVVDVAEAADCLLRWVAAHGDELAAATRAAADGIDAAGGGSDVWGGGV